MFRPSLRIVTWILTIIPVTDLVMENINVFSKYFVLFKSLLLGDFSLWAMFFVNFSHSKFKNHYFPQTCPMIFGAFSHDSKGMSRGFCLIWYSSMSRHELGPLRPRLPPASGAIL